MTDVNSIFAEIEALLDDVAPRALDEIEDTLTTGYAAALALEAERWRTERRISELAAELSTEGDREPSRAREIAKLAQRLSGADADLTRLRELLASLRERADAVRTAA
jgi:chromosome segregation ATPase